MMGGHGIGGMSVRQKLRGDAITPLGVEFEFVRDDLEAHVGDAEIDRAAGGGQLLDEPKRVGSAAGTRDAEEE